MSTSNITSEYDIQLNIKDNTKDAIRALEKGLSEVGSYAKKAGSKLDITESLNESQKAADAMIEKFHEMAKNSELDFDAISKAYSKNAKKAISDLERQYAGIKDQLDEVQKEYDKNAAAIAYQNECLKDGTLSIERRKAIQLIINDLEEQQRKSNIKTYLYNKKTKKD